MLRSDTLAVLALGLVVGLALGAFLTQQTPFQFVPEVALGPVLQTAAVLFLFVLANHVYSNLHNIRKKRMEIVIDMVADVQREVTHLHQDFVECGCDQDVTRVQRLALQRGLQGYSGALKTLEQALTLAKRPGTAEEMQKLIRDRSKYRVLITDVPHPIQFTPQRIKDESIQFNQIRSRLGLFRLSLAR